MYSYVGIQVGRFVCSMLTLKAIMSREVHNSWCSRVLDYERECSYSLKYKRGGS